MTETVSTKTSKNATVAHQNKKGGNQENRQNQRQRQNNQKTENLVFSSIHEAEDYVNQRAQGMEKRFQGRWAGILLEAVPQGYRVVLEKNENEFLKKIQDQRYRHWA